MEKPITDKPITDFQPLLITDRLITERTKVIDIVSTSITNEPHGSSLIDDSVNSLISEFIPSVFSNKLPKTGKPISKTILHIADYIEQVYTHNFANMDFDPDWLKKNKIDLLKLKELASSREAVERIIRRSVKRYSLMFSPEYWPPTKNTMTKSMESWFYNPITHKSWFLYCLFNSLTSIKGKISENYTEALPEKVKEAAEGFLKNHPSWDKMVYWWKVSELNKWMNQNSKLLLEKYPTYAAGAGNMRLMLERFQEFSEELTKESGELSINSFGTNCPTWEYFSNWLLEHWGIGLKNKY